jgi:aryl-alcohol dehydrogenase-like predicted oxidoreductase
MKHDLTRRDFLRASASLMAAGGVGLGRPSGLVGAAVAGYQRGGMVYRRLGQTDLYPSLLSFGSHTDPTDRVPARYGTVLTPAGQARRDHIIAHAFDLGVNMLDIYADMGQWEPAARFIRGRRRDKILISLAHEISAEKVDYGCSLYGHVDMYRFWTGAIDDEAQQKWDVLRKGKEAGKIRAIGISAHEERTLYEALQQLEGIDYLFIPYNFIQARAGYSRFLPEAQRRGVGIVAMKPLSSGSVMKLDPMARPGAQAEHDFLEWQGGNMPVLNSAVAELTRMLARLPDETLCMAAMRFVYSCDFISTAIAGMFEERLLEDNYKAMANYQQMGREEHAALDAARQVAKLLNKSWLPAHYQWLEERWGV